MSDSKTSSNLASAAVPAESGSDLLAAFRCPYHPPCDAKSLLLALKNSAIKNVWPFRTFEKSEDETDKAA